MKIALVSDIHYAKREFERVLPIINTCDYFVFCGDGLTNVNALRYELTVPTVCVKGNCDFEYGAETASAFFGGVKAIVTHGHKYGAKSGLSELVVLAASQNSNLVLFGHTHIPCDKTENGVRLINPGALMEGCFAIVNVFDNMAEHITVERLTVPK